MLARKLERGAAGADAYDEAILLQHSPVYTLGAGSTLDHVLFDAAAAGAAPLVRTERGGEVTWHGPGQLVLYPILNLRYHRADLHWYMRALEEVVIRALARLGLEGERSAGLTGVWVGGAKVAAIGIRAKRWCTYHGVALNVANDLAPFDRIVPCGLAGRAVTSVAALVADRHRAAPAPPELLGLVEGYVLEAFTEVFGLPLHRVAGPEEDRDGPPL